jgi:hypothetical protein
MKTEDKAGLVWTQPVIARARHDKRFEGLSSSEFPIIASLAKLGNKPKSSLLPRNTRKHPLEDFF